MYSVYVQERYIISDKANVKELAFYKKIIDNPIRPKLTYLGDYIGDFPIQYPLTLTNGLVINEDDYYRDTRDYSEE